MQRVCEVKLKRGGGGIKLKKEQGQAVIALLEKDILAVLPTGFDKSLIYQSYSLAKSHKRHRPASKYS